MRPGSDRALWRDKRGATWSERTHLRDGPESRGLVDKACNDPLEHGQRRERAGVSAQGPVDLSGRPRRGRGNTEPDVHLKRNPNYPRTCLKR
jgi:hypothetical protein